MLIADHLVRPQAAPAGSYSWLWIENSVKNGFLEDKEGYLVGRPAGTSRPVGSAEPTKSTRTPFTAEDDLILTKWVLAAEKRGESTKGNVLYEKLAKQVGFSLYHYHKYSD